MQHPCFFGYGSLVNRATHSYPNAHRARATGWRRMWRHTGLRPVAFLTAVPDPNSAIDGMIAAVPGADWDQLDQREWAYERIAAHDDIAHELDHQPEIAIYAVPLQSQAAPSLRHPILLSYIDVVVQGYLEEFGESGAFDFFETTDGWDAPILDDRMTPRYPRHQVLSKYERGFVDEQLLFLSARIEQLE